MTAICGMISWTAILWTSIRWHKGLKAQGIDRSTLVYRAPLQPYLSYCKSSRRDEYQEYAYDRTMKDQRLLTRSHTDGLSVSVMVMIFGGFTSFSKIQMAREKILWRLLG